VVTPLFGGGFEPGEVDTICPIRPAAIRGHLRFWWRATAGAACVSPDKLFEEETKLWGNAEEPGSISLRVTLDNKGTLKKLREIVPKPDSRQGPRQGVFTFPFQENKAEGTEERSGLENAEFTLEVSLPKGHLPEMQKTLKAWLAFGGVGARTRRGCGALSVRENKENWLPPLKDKDWLSSLCSQRATDPPEFTTLADVQVFIGPPQKSAADVWEQLGRFWAAFRKGHVHNDYSPMRGGRWADYRTLSAASGKSPATISLSKPHLGLPIIYQSLKGVHWHGTIEAEQTGRMASPVIIKPVAMSDGRFCPMVAVLKAPAPTAVRIQGRKTTLTSVSDDPVLKSLGVGDPLEAVIAFCQAIQLKTPR